MVVTITVPPFLKAVRGEHSGRGARRPVAASAGSVGATARLSAPLSGARPGTRGLGPPALSSRADVSSRFCDSAVTGWRLVFMVGDCSDPSLRVEGTRGERGQLGTTPWGPGPAGLV